MLYLYGYLQNHQYDGLTPLFRSSNEENMHEARHKSEVLKEYIHLMSKEPLLEGMTLNRAKHKASFLRYMR